MALWWEGNFSWRKTIRSWCLKIWCNLFTFQHFLDGEPTQNNPNPVSANPYERPTHKRKAPTDRSHKSKQSGAKKRCVDTSTCSSTSANELDETVGCKSDKSSCPSPVQTSSCSTSQLDPEAGNDMSTMNPPLKASTPIKVKLKRRIFSKTLKKESTEKSNGPVTCPKCYHKFSPTLAERKRLRRMDFINEVRKSDSNCFLYTGIPSSAMLLAVFSWVKPSAVDMKLWYCRPGSKHQGRQRKVLTLFEEMVLTLVRIRRAYDTRHLAYIFGISQSHVSRIFIAWCKLLAKCLGPVLVWPSQELVRANMPEAFKPYPRTRIVIDATEIFTEKPFRPRAQKLTWSQYKQNNTFKLLVGIMPTGTITLLSKLYAGSISDVYITEKSGLLEKLDPGDDVMADRGFNIRHLLLPRRCTLNIPAFSHGKRLSKKGLNRSRKIAAVRIHVERAIRRMKTFKIISGTVSLKLRFCLDDIITIVAVLSNLQGRLAQ